MMISMSPDSLISPYIEKCWIHWSERSGFLSSNNLLMLPVFCLFTKTPVYPGSSLTSSEQCLRAERLFPGLKSSVCSPKKAEWSASGLCTFFNQHTMLRTQTLFQLTTLEKTLNCFSHTWLTIFMLLLYYPRYLFYFTWLSSHCNSFRKENFILFFSFKEQ